METRRSTSVFGTYLIQILMFSIMFVCTSMVSEGYELRSGRRLSKVKHAETEGEHVKIKHSTGVGRFHASEFDEDTQQELFNEITTPIPSGIRLRYGLILTGINMIEVTKDYAKISHSSGIGQYHISDFSEKLQMQLFNRVFIADNEKPVSYELKNGDALIGISDVKKVDKDRLILNHANGTSTHDLDEFEPDAQAKIKAIIPHKPNVFIEKAPYFLILLMYIALLGFLLGLNDTQRKRQKALLPVGFGLRFSRWLFILITILYSVFVVVSGVYHYKRVKQPILCEDCSGHGSVVSCKTCESKGTIIRPLWHMLK